MVSYGSSFGLSEIHAKFYFTIKNLKKLFNLEFQLLIFSKNLTS